MVQRKRVVRSYQPRKRQAFDDQQWPIDMALVVFGGFMIGSILVYQRFDDPRWYRSPWLSIAGVILLIAATIWTLRSVGNQFVRRTMQLSVVVCAIFHLLMLILALENTIFSQAWEEPRAARDVSEKKPVTIAEYHPSQMQQHEKKERVFEQPVETRLPQPTPRETERSDEQKPETPVPPQPQPVVEPVPEVKPEVVKQRAETMVAQPRQSEQQSRLSRQQTKAVKSQNAAVTVPQVTPANRNTNPQLQSQATAVQRTQASSQQTRQQANAEPATANTRQASNVRRAMSQQQQPTTDRTEQPRVQRRVANAETLPRTQAEKVDSSAVSQKTPAPAVKPANTVARQRTTAAPQRTNTPDRQMTATTSESTQRATRQQPAPRKPTLAQTPQPVANRTPRLTQRPNPQPQVTAPRLPTPVTESASRPLVAANSAIAKSTSKSQTRRPEVTEATRAAQVSSAAAANRATRAQDNPVRETSQNVAQLRRQPATAVSRVTAPTVVTPTPSPGTVTSRPEAVRAPSARVVKQAATVQAPNRSTVNPPQMAPATLPSTSQSVQRSVTGPQQPTAPAPASQVARTTQRRQQTNQSAGVSSQATVAQVTTPSAATPQPTVQSQVSAVSRSRAATGATAQRARTPREPTASTQAGVQTAATRSNQSNDTPAPVPAATQAASLQRTARQARMSVSPEAVAQPAGAAQPAAPSPTRQVAPSAVAKATVGTAGRGESRNLDRALSAASNQASVSSNAARSNATRQNDTGPQLAPAEVATVQRSRAGAERPSATLAPNAVELPTAVASRQPAEATVDASASVRRSQAQVAPGAVTAAKGSVEVELGASQLVDQQNVGRAAGGGQPEIAAQASAAAAAQTSKNKTRALVTSTQVAASAAAPPARATEQATNQGTQPPSSQVGRQEAASRTPVSSPSATTDDPAGASATLPALAQGATRRSEQTMSPTTGVLPEASRTSEEGAGKTTSQQSPSSLSAQQVAEIAAPASTLGDGQPAAASPAMGSPAKVEIAKATAGPEASLATSSPAPITDPMAGLPGSTSGGNSGAQGPAVSRAELTDGNRGQPELGGGTGEPQQAVRGRPLLAPSIATTVTIAGAPQSTGVETGVPEESQGDPAGRLAGGKSAPANDRPAGAVAEGTLVDAPETGTPGIAAANRRQDAGSSAGPEELAADSSGGVLKRASTGRGLPAASTQVTVDLPGEAGGRAPSTETGPPIGGGEVGPVARRATENVPVRADAEDGVGGLGSRIAADAGIASRRASPDSVNVQLQAGRFLGKTSRGVPSFNTRAAVTTNSFQGRKRPDDGGGRGAADPQTEESIDLGLAFLARNQLPDGRWTLSQFADLDGRPAMNSDTAATGLALLAFQGAGYNHQQYKYQQVVRGALQFLLSNQSESGDLYVNQGGHVAIRLYSHAIATLALCEAYGMTQDPDLRNQVQKAIDFIVAAQQPERGGWRYIPGRESDTSVTGWMLMALESGRRANLKVPEETFKLVSSWLDKSADPDLGHLYRYNPFADDTAEQRIHRTATPTMTSVGLLMRLYTGWKTSEARTVKGADYLMENLPSLGIKSGLSQRDTYYWYYATQVMFHMGGKHWKAWNDRLHPLLVDSQVREGNLAGSWDFRRPVMDRWGPHAGRIYLTTMNLLSLEVHYRHLPLYENERVPGKVAVEKQD